MSDASSAPSSLDVTAAYFFGRIVTEQQHEGARCVTVEGHRRYELAGGRFALLGLLWLHAAVYVFYNAIVLLVFGKPSPYRYLWWGLGLGAHASATFAFGARLAARADRKVRRRAESRTS